MNGFNMNQFVLGFAIARPLAEQRDRVMMGLAASMFPASNPLGAIFLKPQVDSLSAREAEVASLKDSLSVAEELLKMASGRDLQVGTTERIHYAGPGDVSVSSAPPGIVQSSFEQATRDVMLVGQAVGIGYVTVTVNARSQVISRRVVAAPVGVAPGGGGAGGGVVPAAPVAPLAGNPPAAATATKTKRASRTPRTTSAVGSGG